MFKNHTCLLFLAASLAMHTIVAMNQQSFDLAKSCYLESQKILQAHNKNQIINELKKIKSSSYSIQSLADIHIPFSIYTIIHDYMAASNIPLRNVILNTTNTKNITMCAYNFIEQQDSSLHGSWCYGALKKVAAELLQCIEIDSLGSRLRTTQLEDRMDEVPK